MLASELIKELQKIVESGGDNEVKFYNPEDGRFISINDITCSYFGEIILEETK